MCNILSCSNHRIQPRWSATQASVVRDTNQMESQLGADVSNVSMGASVCLCKHVTLQMLVFKYSSEGACLCSFVTFRF